MPLDSTNWKPETETKPDVFSLEGLIAWLETQPPETIYSYHDAATCLLTRWQATLGSKLNPTGLSYTSGISAAWGWPFQVALPGEWTFGAALSRARALLASRPKE